MAETVAAAAGREDAQRRASEGALPLLRDLVGDDLAAVDRLILARLDSPVGLIPRLASHIIASGGKRLRPMLTLIAARLCGHPGRRHVPLAACVEFIHTATLLHDDVIDDSALRRGVATANALWGNQASVLVGDFLFSRAFQLMVEDGSLEVLRILAEASAVIAEGEVMQLVTGRDLATTEAAYLEVISAKTAALFAAACELGAVIADRPADERLALREYGFNLGIGFQLVDDGLDYSAAEAALGKRVGDDFREGKVTLPALLAYGRGDDAERAFWRRTLGEGERGEADLGRAIALLERSGALADTLARARRYRDAASAALARFADSPEKRALIAAADFSVERAY